MAFSQNPLSTTYSFLLTLLDKCSRPNPKYFKDKVPFELAHQRNKTVVAFHTGAALIIILQIIIGQSTLVNGLISITASTYAIGLVILSRYYPPQLLKLLYNILVGVVGPSVMWFNEEGAHRAWIGTQLYPTIVLFCTGSFGHFFLQAVFQLTLLVTVYQHKMIGYVNYTSPEVFTKLLLKATFTLSIMNVLVTFCVHAHLQNAQDRIEVVEKKNDEAERQKLFLLGFSHELRNLINSLMGHIKLSSMERISESAKEFLKNADVCGEFLLHLINNILDTGKLEVGELEVTSVPTNIYDTMERTWAVCAELIRRKNLQGKLKIRNNIPKILRIDHYRLMQVFLNLIGNAVKFTETGSINVTVEWISDTHQVTSRSFEPRPFDDDELSEGLFHKNEQFSCIDQSFMVLTSSVSRIDRSLLQDNNSGSKGLLKVTVSDTGYGISKDGLEKVFSKFCQVSSNPSKRKIGTGLGLFVTKQLCERMGGEIKVFSQEGKGSCFTFCIPTCPIPEINLPLTTFTDSDSLENEFMNFKAIIVDDEPFSQVILENFFQKLNIEVVSVADNGAEAVRKYKERVWSADEIPLITMDLTMPLMDGQEASEKIRQFERENEMKPCVLIIISGNISQSEIAQCLDPERHIRANAFLKKPARLDDISSVLSEYLSKRKHGISLD